MIDFGNYKKVDMLRSSCLLLLTTGDAIRGALWIGGRFGSTLGAILGITWRPVSQQRVDALDALDVLD